ncbi:chromatin binding protein [Lobulomyces angularis]|nr:chromatin binding protein [Lobulomyces angularis]
MNIPLHDPFILLSFPDILTDRLDLENHSLTLCQFNPNGLLLAAATFNGMVLIVDTLTNGITHKLYAHVSNLNSLTWHKNGRYLLTAGSDYKVFLFDFQLNARMEIDFEAPLSCAFFHIDRDDLIVACPIYDTPVAICLSRNDLKHKRVKFTGLPASDKKTVYCGCFSNKYPNTLYLGSNKGLLFTVNVETTEVIETCRATGGASIKSIKQSNCGNYLLINCSDRILRLLSVGGDSGELVENLVKYMDSVERCQWMGCDFSSSGDYVIGAAAQKNSHKIYIWDMQMGNLVKMLQGPMESILDLAWHPCRPLIASVSEYSGIYIWTVTVSENWSAFAPDFREIEENLEYQEKEDEFDNVPISLLLESRKRQRELEENVLVDVVEDSIGDGVFLPRTNLLADDDIAFI